MDNMYKETREIQDKLFEILLYFKKFCDENNLHFVLAGGTCIGAARHKGFIPWDDDLDVFMLREDYEKLPVLWKKYADTDRYSCVRSDKDMNIHHGATEIKDNNTTFIVKHNINDDVHQGLMIDVIPLDGVAENKMLLTLQMMSGMLFSCFNFQRLPEHKGGFTKFVTRIALGLVRSKKWRYRIWKIAEKNMSRYKVENHKNVASFMEGLNIMNQHFPKEWFLNPGTAEFEGVAMPVPRDIDKYLKISYGDYMKLPPHKERIPRHEVTFMDLNSCYKKYKGIKYMKKNRDNNILNTIRTGLSTRKTMQMLPPVKDIHYISDDELKDLQKVFLDMIKDIDKVCKDNNICYMAAGGTALGSVRHKGFIPWDDDVDLLMPRKDLKKFLKIFDKSMGEKYMVTSPDSNYKLESMITGVYKKNTYKASLQTMDTNLPKGVHIDIFPIETVPKNKIYRLWKGYFAMGIQYIAVSTLFRELTNEKKKEFFCQTKAGKINYSIRMGIGKMFSFMPASFWAKLFNRCVSCKRDTGIWAVPTDIGHYFGHIMDKDVYYPPVKGEFEGFMINLPHNTDEYLKNQYGNYMEIPPESERERHWSIGFSLDLKGGKNER